MDGEVLHLLLRALAIRDVDDGTFDQRGGAVRTLHERRVLEHPDRSSVAPAGAHLVVVHGSALGEAGQEGLPVPGTQVEVERRLVESLLGRGVAEDPGEGGVALEDPAIQAGPEHSREVALEQRPVELLGLPQGALGATSIGEVVDVPGEDGGAFRGQASDGQLDGELGAVPPHRRHLERLAEDGSLSGREVVGHSPPIELAKRGRNEELGHGLSEHVGSRISEHPLGRGIEFQDVPGSHRCSGLHRGPPRSSRSSGLRILEGPFPRSGAP